MRSKLTFTEFFKSNLYLLVIAAWLVTFSFIIDNYWSAGTNTEVVKQKLQGYIGSAQKDVTNFLADSLIQAALKKGNLSEEDLKLLTEKKYYLYSYLQTDTGLQLKQWTSQNVLPTSEIIFSPAKEGASLLSNGLYVWNKYVIDHNTIISLVPIKWNYIVTNDYLENSFEVKGELDRFYAIDTLISARSTIIKSPSGTQLFSLIKKNETAYYRNYLFSVLFRLLAVLMLLMFIHLYVTYLSFTKRFLTAIFLLISTIIVLRALSYFFPVPLNLRQFELFDPAIYGSSFILRSLGDLLINVLLFLWIVLFIRHQVHEKKIVLNFSHPYAKWASLITGNIILVGAAFTGVSVLRSLVADSQISFDVLNFFSLNTYSIISFIVLCCMSISYYFLSQVVIYLIKPLFPDFSRVFFLALTICGLLFLSFTVGEMDGNFAIYTLLWLLVFIFLINNEYLNLFASKIIASRFIFWIFFFSISIVSVIIIENNRKEFRNRLHYAEILITKSDPASEFLLNSMLSDFRLDFLSDNFKRLSDKQQNKYFKDSLISNNFSGYTNRFGTRIFSFDDKERPLFNDENIEYNRLNTILNTQAKPTAVAGLYYYDESYEKFSYITKKEIKDASQNIIGSIFILVSPKNIKSETLYPELFSKGHQNAIENSSEYAFAIYNKQRLISSHNDYPFATIYPGRYYAGKQYQRIAKGNFDELWYNAGSDKHVVIVKENNVSIESITLFSYLFCSFLLLTSLLWFLNIFIKSRFNPQKLQGYWQLTIRNQIHGIIIFISTLSFIVIGIATILFFISRYENNNREKLSAAIQIMENQLSKQLGGTLYNTDSAGLQKKKSLEQLVNNISEIHGVDINLYDLNGNLIISSLPLPYDKGIVSTKINPIAYFHLHVKHEVQFFQKENIGKLFFVSNYVPVVNTGGDVYAYLNIPYYTSQSKLKQEISNFLVTIINLNAFIFLIAGILALFITNRITNSFSVISEKMKKVNLGIHNEAIEWDRDDEIGALVKEYNKMLSKLELSAAALAKTEREGAWREMARQVAHEIKNPLTPMKLSMQFLQKSIENNAPNVKQLAESVSGTLIEQIDHLSKIASEFSQFANIEHSKNEKVDLNEALLSIKLLYSSGDMDIEWNLVKIPVIILADKTHINRLFTNLIQNAAQAVPEGKRPNIQVLEWLDEVNVNIKLTDNGEGIDEEIIDKIFTPNFTTKTSGTGLGLAMCKRIVEQANGKIWFETALQKGTSFYIQFPLVNP
ncbi:MAG: HAMP domain-containing sensor histidine kinase [Ferruginibacter sp.]